MYSTVKHLIRKVAFCIMATVTLVTATQAATPGWTIKPTDFSYSMSMVVAVYVNGAEPTGNLNVLGAFKGATCVGKITPTYNNTTHHWLYYISVYGNTNGDSIDFKFYNSLTDNIIAMQKKIAFTPDAIIGSATEPYNTMNVILKGKSFNSFTLPGQQASYIEADTIYCAIKSGSNLKNLKPIFSTSDGATVKVASDVQYSGITANNFDNAVTYEVKAADGSGSSFYIIKAVSFVKSITASVFIDSMDVLNATDTLYAYQHGFLMGKAIPALNSALNKWRFSINPLSFKPSGEYTFKFLRASNSAQYNILRVLNFISLDPVGKQSEPYILSNPSLTKNALLSISISGQIGETKYSGKSIQIILTKDADKTALTPKFALNAGAFAKIADSVIYSSISKIDFTNTVLFKVYNSLATVVDTYKINIVDYRLKVTASVFIDSIEQTNTADTLYAYANNFLLGKASPVKNAYYNKYRISLFLYSHTEVSNITFRYYSKAKNVTFNLARNSNFVNNSEIGSNNEPFVLSNPELNGKSLVSFAIPGQIGETKYFGKSVHVVVSKGVDRSTLKPNFILSAGAFAKLTDSVVYSGITKIDFNNTVELRIYNSTAASVDTYKIDVVDYRLKITASVFIDSIEQANLADTLYAYANNFLLGKASPVKNELYNKYRIQLYIYSHTDVSDISFRYYSKAQNGVFDLTRKLNFSNNIELGSNNEPLVLSNIVLTGNLLKNFTISGQYTKTRYSDSMIWLIMPRGVSRSNLIPQFTLSAGAYLKIADSVQYSGITANNYSNPVDINILSSETTYSRKYKVNVVDYRMFICATVLMDSIEAMDVTDTLYAYTNGLLMAKATPSEVEALKKNRLLLEVYSHTNNVPVEFKYYSAAKNKIFSLSRTLMFINDTAVGTPAIPFVLSNPELSGHSFLTFSLPNQVGTTIFDSTTIKIIMPVNSNIQKITPSFKTTAGSHILIGDSAMYSNISEVDFSNALNYRVYSSNMSSHTDYKVYVILNELETILANDIISPNGDGINDFWTVKDPEKLRDSKVYIINNYGTIIYQNNGYDARWDGKYKGSYLPIGVCYYVIKSPDGKVAKGTITILK